MSRQARVGTNHPSGPPSSQWLAAGMGLALRLVGVFVLVGLGLALARLPLTYAAALILGGIGLVIVLVRPSLALYPLAVAVPFGSLQELSLGGLTVGASEVLVGGMTIGWAMRAVAMRRPLVRPGITRHPLVVALGAYLAVLLLSLLSVINLTAALKELLKWTEMLVVLLFVASEVSPKQRSWVAGALLLAASVEALYGVYQFLFQVGPPGFILFGRYMRAYGTFEQPNPFGGYLGLLLPLAYAGWMIWWLGRRAGMAGSIWERRLLAGVSAGATICLAAGLVMSWSRGALLGAAGGLALVFTALGKRAWAVLLVVGLLLLLVAPSLGTLVSADWIDRLLGAGSISVTSDLRAVEIDDENFSIVERLAHWQAAWSMFAQRPWLGVGTGQYATVYPTVALPRWQDPLGHAHNYYLNVLAETGLLGLGVYVLFLIASVRTAWTKAWRSHGSQRWLALGALGMLGHLMAHSLVDNLYVHEMYLLMAVLLGLIMQPSTNLADAKAATSNSTEHSMNAEYLVR